MEQITVNAYAKVNLGLDVIRKREDGYHEVKMIMQTVSLHDVLTIKRTNDSGITIRTNLDFLPVNRNNLIYQAAKRLMEHCKMREGISVDLKKHIPVAAGMAGGSADAAAVLHGINAMFELGLNLKELQEIGVKIGADVPYCLMQGTALAEGIGEKLTELPAMPDCPVLIAKPPISVSTKFVYENLKLNAKMHHPDIDAQIQAIHRQDLKTIAECMGNVLETVTIPNYPVIDQIKSCMTANGAIRAMMSGSGPTVFGLFFDMETAKDAEKALRRSNLARQICVTGMQRKPYGSV